MWFKKICPKCGEKMYKHYATFNGKPYTEWRCQSCDDKTREYWEQKFTKMKNFNGEHIDRMENGENVFIQEDFNIRSQMWSYDKYTKKYIVSIHSRGIVAKFNNREAFEHYVSHIPDYGIVRWP